MSSKEFKKFIAASIMGDGYFFKVDQENPKANTKYLIKQVDTHKDYLEKIAEVLETLTRVNLSHSVAYTDDRGYNCQGKFVLESMRHPVYKEMYNRLYRHEGNTHVKVIDPHYMTLFDIESLAMMYMDDGWLEVEERVTMPNHVRLGIATHKYSYYENLYLRDFIAEKFGFHFDVMAHKQKSGNFKYYLRAKGRDNCMRFLNGVEKFIVPSYHYKLDTGLSVISSNSNVLDGDKVRTTWGHVEEHGNDALHEMC